jgi:hypothetical protein
MILEVALGIVLGFILLAVLPHVAEFLFTYWWPWVPPVALGFAGLLFGGLHGMVVFALVGLSAC